MPIDEIIQPADEPKAAENLEVLDLTEEQAAAALADDGGEPLDEPEYPETLDEIDPAEETPLIKQLRERDKDRTRMLREKDRLIEELRNKKPVVRTPEPDLYDEGIDGDIERYNAARDAWKENERAADEAERAPTATASPHAQQWEQELQTYKANAVKLGKADFADAETAVVSTLDAAQQSTIVMAAKDPARFIYALGRSPVRLAQLAEITNPIKLAAEVARIEGARIMPRKEPVNIDTPLRGNARLSTAPANKQVDAITKKLANGGEMTAEMRATLKAERTKAA